MGTQDLLRAASGKGWGDREQSSALIPWHWLSDLAGVVINCSEKVCCHWK